MNPKRPSEQRIPFFRPAHAHQRIANTAQFQLAACRAAGTGCDCRFFLNGYALYVFVLLPKRSRRADRRALAAGYAVRILQRFAEFGRNGRVKASVGKADGGHAHCFVADTHAKAAENAFFRILFYIRVFIVPAAFALDALQTSGKCVVFACVSQQFALKDVVTAALKAARGFVYGGFLRKTGCDFLKIILAFLGVKNCHRARGDFFSVREILPVTSLSTMKGFLYGMILPLR